MCQIWAGSAGWFIQRASPLSSADPAVLRAQTYLRRCITSTSCSVDLFSVKKRFTQTFLLSSMASDWWNASDDLVSGLRPDLNCLPTVLQADCSRHRPVRLHGRLEQFGSVLGESDPRVRLRPWRGNTGPRGHDPILESLPDPQVT